MMRVGAAFISGLAVCFGCSARQGNIAEDSKIDAGRVDGPMPMPTPVPDAGLGAWGPATKITPAATAQDEDDTALSSSGTELIYSVSITATDKDLFVMKRATTSDPFGARQELTGLNTAGIEQTPRLSPDNLTLYFARGTTIYKSTRASVSSAWGAPTAMAGGNPPELWYTPCGADHFFVVRGQTDLDLYGGTVGTTGTNITALNTAKVEAAPFPSPDCLTLYFTSDRSGTSKIYQTMRDSITSPWRTPELAPSPFNDGVNNQDASLSMDQRIFVWASIRGGTTNKDVYMSTR